jgi:hypothetical protein
MINPISNQNPMSLLKFAPQPVTTVSSAKLSTGPTGNEISTPVPVEMKETFIQNTAEAMRTLVSQESIQRQFAAPKNIVSVQAALAAYQQ